MIIHPEGVSVPKPDAAPKSAAVSEAKTYYVSTAGSDSNDGLSLDAPFQTIRKAAQTVQPGDTVFVRAGSYNESISMKNSGTKKEPITFRNYNEEEPVIDGTGKTAEAGVKISSRNYIIFDGFTVQNFTTDDKSAVIGISVEGDSKGVEIRNCKVHDINTTYSSKDLDRNAHGIAVYGTSNDLDDPINGLVLDNNEVYNCRLGQSEAVVLNGNVSNFAVTNNKIHDNDNIGIDFIGFEGTANDDKAGDAKAMQDRARNGVCTGNQVWNISSTKNPTYRGEEPCADGIYADGAYNIIIEKNKVDKCDIGIEAASEHLGCSAVQIIIRNNLVTNCKNTAGISIGGADATKNGDARKIQVINNTLYNNRPNINISNANSSTNIVVNNICFRGTYLEGTIGKNNITNNMITNPHFVNTTTWDFNLKPDSPAIDTGVTADYGNADMAGNDRVKGKAVDYGAFEYQQK
jgi:hypothetical protein